MAGSRPQGPVGSPGPWGLKLRFFGNLLVGAWRRRGCRLKRLLRRWGPGGKRSRDTPPTPPTPPPHFGCKGKGERKRVFTLSAFGNHPTQELYLVWAPATGIFLRECSQEDYVLRSLPGCRQSNFGTLRPLRFYKYVVFPVRVQFFYHYVASRAVPILIICTCKTTHLPPSCM